MIICPGPKVAFIHIYKTGGSSLTRVLSRYTVETYRAAGEPRFNGEGWQDTWHLHGQQHSKFQQNKKALSEIVDDQWNYVVVARNPYEWFASVFFEFYLQDRKWKAGSNFLFGKVSKNRTFEDYVDFYQDFKSGYPEFWGFSTQKSFIAGVPPAKLNVIKFENYEQEVRSTMASLGIVVEEIQHDLKRGSDKEKFKNYLMAHPRFIPFVNDVFAEDFDTFGYQKVQ